MNLYKAWGFLWLHHERKSTGSGDFLLQGAILASAGMITRIIGIAYRVPLTYIVGDEGMGFYGYAFEVYSIALLLILLQSSTCCVKAGFGAYGQKERSAMRSAFFCARWFLPVP